MTKDELKKELSEAYELHLKTHGITVKAVNKFMNEHPEGMTKEDLDEEFQRDKGNSCIYEIADSIIFQGVWILDRLQKRKGAVGSIGYSRSLAKKVRKALGYTI